MSCSLLMAGYNLFADTVMQAGRGEVRGTRTWSFEISAGGQGEEILLKERSGRWESQVLAALTSASAVGLAYKRRAACRHVNPVPFQ